MQRLPASSKKQAIVTTMKFEPISSRSQFQKLFELLKGPPCVILLSGPTGCGKSFAVHRLAKETNRFLATFDPINVDLEKDIVAAGKAIGFKKRILLIDDLDGFTPNGIKIIEKTLKTRFRPESWCHVVVTLTGFKSITIKSEDWIHKISIFPPTSADFLKYVDRLKKKGKSFSHMQQQLERIAEGCNGDIRQFGMHVSKAAKFHTDSTFNVFDVAKQIFEKHPDRVSNADSLDNNLMLNEVLRQNATCVDDIDMLADMFDAYSVVDTFSVQSRDFSNATLAFSSERKTSISKVTYTRPPPSNPKRFKDV